MIITKMQYWNIRLSIAFMHVDKDIEAFEAQEVLDTMKVK